jgi:hypothetical protein
MCVCFKTQCCGLKSLKNILNYRSKQIILYHSKQYCLPLSTNVWVSFCHLHSNAVPLCFLVGVTPRWITQYCYVVSRLGFLEDESAAEHSAALHSAHRSRANFHRTVAILKVSQHCVGHKPMVNSKILLFFNKKFVYIKQGTDWNGTN